MSRSNLARHLIDKTRTTALIGLDMDNYYDLGTYSRSISTTSPEAQVWFDRGLMWLYGYNHDEAITCFRKAIAVDPSCVMAYWGVAYGAGCNYNKAWEVFSPDMVAGAMQAARTALNEAYQHVDRATALEAALIRALEKRFQREGAHDVEVLERWNSDYANAMREVYHAFPDDFDVVTLFAEALINRTPWQLWNLETGLPADGADTHEAIAVLERAIKQVEDAGLPPHPGLLHIYIHVLEMSPHPEKALRAADQLRELVRDAGHLVHMPSHIDILCGDYYNSIVANQHAIDVDNAFVARDGEMNEYTFYRAHNIHFKIYSAMLLGQFNAALQGAEEMAALAHDDLLRVTELPMADQLEGMLSMRVHVLIRFGKWHDILALPFPDDAALYCNTVAMLHYARAIAFATLHRHDEANAERLAFGQTAAAVPDTRFIFNNTCIDVLQIADAMMNGEVEYHQGNIDAAFAHLRKAVYLDDHLNYAEPWGWMMPTRHALGALLLEQGLVEDAAAVYRADLGLDQSIFRPMQHPNNVWSLHGYVTCLEQMGERSELHAMRRNLDLALARADVEISASCFCAAGHHDHHGHHHHDDHHC